MFTAFTKTFVVIGELRSGEVEWDIMKSLSGSTSSISLSELDEEESPLSDNGGLCCRNEGGKTGNIGTKPATAGGGPGGGGGNMGLASTGGGGGILKEKAGAGGFSGPPNGPPVPNPPMAAGTPLGSKSACVVCRWPNKFVFWLT